VEGTWGVRSVGDGRNQLEDAWTRVSNGVWTEGVSTDLEGGERVDVKGEESTLKQPSTPDILRLLKAGETAGSHNSPCDHRGSR